MCSYGTGFKVLVFGKELSIKNVKLPEEACIFLGVEQVNLIIILKLSLSFIDKFLMVL